MNPNEITKTADGQLDPLQMAQRVETLFAQGAISLVTFLEMLRQCHEALKAVPARRQPTGTANLRTTDL